MADDGNWEPAANKRKPTSTDEGRSKRPRNQFVMQMDQSASALEEQKKLVGILKGADKLISAVTKDLSRILRSYSEHDKEKPIDPDQLYISLRNTVGGCFEVDSQRVLLELADACTLLQRHFRAQNLEIGPQPIISLPAVKIENISDKTQHSSTAEANSTEQDYILETAAPSQPSGQVSVKGPNLHQSSTITDEAGRNRMASSNSQTLPGRKHHDTSNVHAQPNKTQTGTQNSSKAAANPVFPVEDPRPLDPIPATTTKPPASGAKTATTQKPKTTLTRSKSATDKQAKTTVPAKKAKPAAKKK